MEEENSDSQIVASFKKNNREFICAGLSRWKGRDLFFIRMYYPAAEGEELLPSREGITMSVEKFPEIMAAIKTIDLAKEDQPPVVIRKNSFEEVHVGAGVYKDMRLLNLRIYSMKTETGDAIPTKKGIAINTELLPDLLALLEKLEAALSQKTDHGSNAG